MTFVGEKIFDLMGRLRRIGEVGSPIYQDVIYSGDSVDPIRIQHSLGNYLDFTYEEVMVDSSYLCCGGAATYRYLASVRDNEGRNAKIAWDKNLAAVSGGYRLITSITYPGNSDFSDTGREYEYNDSRWPASITDIYDVSSYQSNIRTTYAEFRYDERGRAIYSALATGSDAVSVEYVDIYTRKVTSALGKVATYHFEKVNGATRLNDITGKPTATCVPSEVGYSYDPAGNMASETPNGATNHIPTTPMDWQFDDLRWLALRKHKQ